MFLFLFLLTTCRTLLPLVLAQLLIQFQKPITENITNSTMINSTTPPLNDTLNRVTRNAQLYDEQYNKFDRSLTDGKFYSVYKNLRFPIFSHDFYALFPPSTIDYNSNRLESLNNVADSDSKSTTETLDDVRNESVKFLLPPAIQKPDKDEEFRLNFTRADFESAMVHVWNDVYWLAYMIVLLGIIGFLFGHHYNLRLQLIGARMRIACCSLIYRKVRVECDGN